MQSYDVIIIGAGPAGIATARALSKVSPGLAARTLLLDQRPNMLPPDSGASTLITGASARAIEALEIDARVPEVALSEVCFEDGERSRAVPLSTPWALVDRYAFDARMFHQVSCALEVRLGEQVKGVDHQGDWVRVETQQRVYRAQVVIGADGARSAVRALLGWPAQAIAHADDSCGWVSGADIDAQGGPPPASLRYDLSKAARGQGGLAWYAAGGSDASPRICAGQIQHSRLSHRLDPPTPLRCDDPSALDGAAHLNAWLQARGWQAEALPSPYQRPYQYSAVLPIGGSRVLLVGDAAGVVPLLDDGLYQRLEYGCFAAYALSDAFERRDFNFQRHGAALRSSPLGRELHATQRMCARLFGPDHALWRDRLLHPRGALAPLLVAQASGDTTLDAQRYRLAWIRLMVRLRGGRWR